jgi:hypothetical protein
MIFNFCGLEFKFACWIPYLPKKKIHNPLLCTIYLLVLRTMMFIPDPNFSILGPDPDRNKEFKHF